MKMWIARTERNVLTIHQSEPQKVIMDSNTNEFFWISDIETQSFLNRNLFPEVTFENSPMEVELVIKNKMERVVTIPIYETRKIEPYPSCEGRQFKKNVTPKLAMMVKECPRFKRKIEEVELKLTEK